MSGWGEGNGKPKQKHYAGKPRWSEVDAYAPIVKGKWKGEK
jgi:hypothetical protein